MRIIVNMLRQGYAIVVSFLVFEVFIRVPTVVGQDNDDVAFVQTITPCPSGNNISGYVTIEAMNNDMINELDNIRSGRPAQEPYIFVLCPDTVFNASVDALKPVLNGVVFTCGIMGDPALRCDVVGGANQVIIDNPVNITNYSLQTISFLGITFLGFTNSAISGAAGSATTIDLYRSNFDVCFFRDFSCKNKSFVLAHLLVLNIGRVYNSFKHA
jgi:hypothetical protein